MRYPLAGALVSAVCLASFAFGEKPALPDGPRPAAPQAPETALPDNPPPAEEPGSGQLDDSSGPLERAELLYAQGVELLRAGKVLEGRSSLAQAFGLLTSLMDGEALVEDLQSDFMNMLDKTRSWERSSEGVESPSELSISPEELKKDQPLTASTDETPRKSKRSVIPIDPENPLVKKYVQVYTEKRRESVEQALARSGRYRPAIEAAIKKAGLPRELFYLVMAESEYKLMAHSRAGAAGLWQFMPFTARKYGLEVSYWVDERFDPEKATPAALRYLSDLYAWFRDWHLAMAAYNRGEGGLGRDLMFSRSVDFSGLANRNALPNETENYVPKFMACTLIGENPASYGFAPAYEKPEPYDVVELERDLDLGVAARCAGTTLEVIQRLNPALRAWCTPKGRPGFKLRIPENSKEAFLAALANVSNWNPGPEFVRYRVRKGDSVGRIANRYRTTVTKILQHNKISDARRLRVGMTLKVQPGKGYHPSATSSPAGSRAKAKKKS